MARKRKYEKVSNYWVYSIKVPSVGKFYIGVSKRLCCQRWRKSQYKGKSLEPYLNEWQDMIKTVLVDNLTKEQAYQYEDNIIRALSMNNLCINTNRSGLITNDAKQYYEDNKERIKQYYEDNKERIKQYYEDNKEQIKEYQKQYREDNKEKVQEQQKQYYENNKERHKQLCKQWQKDNKEKYREYQREYQRQLRLKKKQQQNQQLSLF